jgi:hypothetical protein
MIMRKLVGIVAILIAGGVSTQAAGKEDFEAAKKEYQASSHDEAARVTYVTKLAQLKVELLKVPNGARRLEACNQLGMPKASVPKGR